MLPLAVSVQFFRHTYGVSSRQFRPGRLHLSEFSFSIIVEDLGKLRDCDPKANVRLQATALGRQDELLGYSLHSGTTQVLAGNA